LDNERLLERDTSSTRIIPPITAYPREHRSKNDKWHTGFGFDTHGRTSFRIRGDERLDRVPRPDSNKTVFKLVKAVTTGG
jgi:hypothetical protein